MADLHVYSGRVLMFLAFTMAAQLPMQFAPSQKTEPASRVKVFEGEYAMTGGGEDEAPAPFETAIYNFRETFTMWQTANGYYEVEGERHYESPQFLFHNDRFTARLSASKRLLSVTDYSKLRYRKDSGPLTCDFYATDVQCSSNAKNLAEAIDVRVPIEYPAALFTPLSPLSWASVTRGMDKRPNEIVPVQMLSIREMSAKDPVALDLLSGVARYIRSEDINAAGRTWRADRYEVKLPMYPKYTVWTSSDGILLAVAFGSSDDGLRLRTFRDSYPTLSDE